MVAGLDRSPVEHETVYSLAPRHPCSTLLLLQLPWWRLTTRLQYIPIRYTRITGDIRHSSRGTPSYLCRLFVASLDHKRARLTRHRQSSLHRLQTRPEHSFQRSGRRARRGVGLGGRRFRFGNRLPSSWHLPHGSVYVAEKDTARAQLKKHVFPILDGHMMR